MLLKIDYIFTEANSFPFQLLSSYSIFPTESPLQNLPYRISPADSAPSDPSSEPRIPLDVPPPAPDPPPAPVDAPAPFWRVFFAAGARDAIGEAIPEAAAAEDLSPGFGIPSAFAAGFPAGGGDGVEARAGGVGRDGVEVGALAAAAKGLDGSRRKSGPASSNKPISMSSTGDSEETVEIAETVDVVTASDTKGCAMLAITSGTGAEIEADEEEP